LSIGFFFIWIFLRQLNIEQRQDIIQSFRNADYSWVLLSIFVGAISHFIRAERWRLLMKPMGYRPKLSNTFFAVMIGYFANLALPRLGEVTRCGILNKYEKIPVNKSFGTVIAERSIDMIVFLLLFFINLWVFWDQLRGYVNTNVFNPMGERFSTIGNSSAYLWIIGSVLAVLFVTWFIIHNFYREAKFYLKIKNILKGFVEGFKSVLQVKQIGLFILYSILIWVMYYLMVYVCFFSMAETTGLGFGPGLAVLIFGSIGIMVVQGGIGVYPAIVAETLAIYGIAEVKGYALGWITWSAQNVMIVSLGVLSLILLPLLTRKRNHEHATGKITEKDPELETSAK
jgi:uncharacterized membrane protein YbhN (UPF0104 family)